MGARSRAPLRPRCVCGTHTCLTAEDPCFSRQPPANWQRWRLRCKCVAFPAHLAAVGGEMYFPLMMGNRTHRAPQGWRVVNRVLRSGSEAPNRVLAQFSSTDPTSATRNRCYSRNGEYYLISRRPDRNRRSGDVSSSPRGAEFSRPPDFSRGAPLRRPLLYAER